MISRRSLLRTLPVLLAAPAIVKASSLMAVTPWRHDFGDGVAFFAADRPWDGLPPPGDLNEASIVALALQIAAGFAITKRALTDNLVGFNDRYPTLPWPNPWTTTTG